MKPADAAVLRGLKRRLDRPAADALVHLHGARPVSPTLAAWLAARGSLSARLHRAMEPLAVARLAAQFPATPFIVPHFGAGLFREALMAADLCANVHLDTSSSNGWIRYHPGLTLESVFRTALAVAGPTRLLFGTDSSFFPRGWQKPILDQQMAALNEAGVSDADQALVLGGNFDRIFGGHA